MKKKTPTESGKIAATGKSKLATIRAATLARRKGKTRK